ncbi:MAG: TraR/DksA C4-type zinc finger protein [bacterium]
MSNDRSTRRGRRRHAGTRTVLPRGYHRPRYVTEDLDTYKGLLLGLREEAMKELEASKNNGHTKQGQNKPHEAELIEELDAALERIKQHEYGCCEKCGLLIDKMRLMAMPHTRRCFACNSDAKSGVHRYISN